MRQLHELKDEFNELTKGMTVDFRNLGKERHVVIRYDEKILKVGVVGPEEHLYMASIEELRKITEIEQ